MAITQATLKQVQEIYIGLLSRAADLEGLNYWAREITNGLITIEQVRANIVNEQPEYAANLGAILNRTVLVTTLYRNMFNRDAEPEGLNYWVDGGGKTVNADQLVLALSDGASSIDRLTLDNRAEIANFYTSNAAFNVANAASALLNVATANDVITTKLMLANVFAAEAATAASKTVVMTAVPNPVGAGAIFALDGVNKPELNLVRGAVYVFDQSNASNSNHQIAFKDANGLSYTTGVVTTGIAGQAGAKTTFTVASDAPEGLRYYCVAHGNNMGNIIANSGGAASFFVAEAMSDQAYGSNFAGGAANYYNTSASETDNAFMLFNHSFDDALEFAGVTLVGTVEFNY